MKTQVSALFSTFAMALIASANVAENLNNGVAPNIPGQARSAPPAAVVHNEKTTLAGERFIGTDRSVHTVDLGPATSSELKKASASSKARDTTKAKGNKGGRIQIGFARDVPENLRTVPLSLLPWQLQSDGSRTLKFEVAAPGAQGMRVGYRFDGPADGAELRFASSAANSTVYKAIASTGKELLWSPTLDGERGMVEIRVRAGFEPSAFSLVLEQISQMTVASSQLKSAASRRPDVCPGDNQTGIGCSQACNVDFACVTNPSQALIDISRATAKLSFVEAGSSYICTGTLLNSAPFTGTPYLFTAAHCIDSQSSASTLETIWFFDSVACESLTTQATQRITTGAALLVTDETMDVTLLRMNSSPPNGAVFAAWDASVIPKSATLVGIHHPTGDLKAFSQGTMRGYVRGPQICEDANGNDVTCDTYRMDSYIGVNWSDGTTEGGSSGSGIFSFNTNCGSGQACYQLRGGLEGGAASCSNPGGLDIYSRMDLLYTRLAPYLAPSAQIPATGGGVAVMMEFYNPEFNFYFMTSREEEKELLRVARDGKQNLLYYPTGYWFKTDQFSSPTTSSVVRYFNGKSANNFQRGLHFYTATNQDKQTITNSGLERFSSQRCADVPRFWCNEGIDSYVTQPLNFNVSCPAGLVPIYRAFRLNADDGTHRFMPSNGLYQYVLRDDANLGDVWSAEGVAFCARP
jgi:lysyl endopeptidase